MPPRISRGSTQSSNIRSSGKTNNHKSKKSQKRSLNAFAIASHENPDRIKIRQHRLGESEIDHSRGKRRREDDNDGDEEDEEPSEGRKRKQKKVEKDRFDELSIDEGSDSEGNAWQMGQVDEDNDSDIDSDEAFGESDEERFEGWAFRGSSSNGQRKPKKKASIEQDDGEDFDLAEGDSAVEADNDDENSLGEDAVDLATMLDQYEEDEEEQDKSNSRNYKKRKDRDSDSEDGSSGDSSDISSVYSDESSSDEDDEEEETTRRSQLKDLISSLQLEEGAIKKSRTADVNESAPPSEFGALRKIDFSSLQSKITDADKKKSLKLLRDDIKPSKRNDIARKLDAPLPKRQQDRLNRAAANEKANETLGRWVDTVKHNRRAEHLMFPLKHPNEGEAMGESRLLPTTALKPTNDLESTIQSILQDSGLSTKNGNANEDAILKWEELQTNKLPLEEVQARRAELRKARELLFREEVRAKRIKKIKSKAYRRVHRKERERMAEREQAALVADGVDLSEDEREHNDRRRAEERMGAKHRESKWAKSVKNSGKAAWDDDARAGVTEMARRNEELRRRIEGKEVHGEDEDGSDLSSEGDEYDDDDADADVGTAKLRSHLGRLNEGGSDETSKLGSMLFMQRAEAARRARNDEDIEHLRRELAGEESQSEEEDGNAVGLGRRKFGPVPQSSVVPAIRVKGSDFEERDGSDSEVRHIEPSTDDATTERPKNPFSTRSGRFTTKLMGRQSPNSSMINDKPAESSNPYLTKLSEQKRKSTGLKPVDEDDKIPSDPNLTQKPEKKESPALAKAQDMIGLAQKRSKKSSKRDEPNVSVPDVDGWSTVTYKHDDDDEEDSIESEGIELPFVLRNQSLTAKAFAGDDVEEQFQAEKALLAKEEDEQVVDETLPGWGTWVGEGLSKKAQAKNKGKVLTKREGIRADKRKDAGLDRVIINQKRVKKNSKFMASELPFPFQSREQYERSLRLPKGPDWLTKQAFQDGTKPRVLLKQGIIRPMSKPLV